MRAPTMHVFSPLLCSSFLFNLFSSFGLTACFFGGFSNLYFLGFGRLASKSFACCLESRIWDLGTLVDYCASSFLQLRETPTSNQKDLFHCWKDIILKNSINCLKDIPLSMFLYFFHLLSYNLTIPPFIYEYVWLYMTCLLNAFFFPCM